MEGNKLSKHQRSNKIKALLAKSPMSKRQVVGATLMAGLVAAFVSSGTATARDYVTSGDVKNQTLQSWDIAPSGVGRSELRKDSVGWSEVREGTIDSSELTDGGVKEKDLDAATREKLNAGGPKGEPGKDGTDGEDGADGKDGVSGYEVIGRGTDAKTVTPEDGVVTITTKCASADSGDQQQAEVALGGGATGGGNVTLHASHPSGIEQVSDADSDDPAGRWKATSWTVKVSTKESVNVQPYVLCALMN